MKTILLTVAFLFGSFTSALALSDFSVLYIVQLKLSEMGYYSARIDGQNGPSTRAAMIAFSDEHGGEATLWSVVETISSKISAPIRQSVSDEMEQAVKTGFEEILNDGESARYIFDYSFPVAGRAGTIAVCGKINGKNVYGAYVGYKPFQMVLIPVHTPDAIGWFTLTMDPLADESEMLCMLSTAF